MHIYRFLTNSNIQKIELDFSPLQLNNLSLSLANPKYNQSKHIICIDQVENLFLVLHPDNTNISKYNSSPLPMNLAIQKYFWNSHFIGDALLVKLSKDEEIVKEDWHHSLLNAIGTKKLPDCQLL